MLDGFAEDSFFTLTLAERVGLGCLSLLMLALVAWIICLLFRRIHIFAALILAILLYWAFLWIAPQIYYLYYIAIFDGLPWQIVIGAPPALIKIISFSTGRSLSELSQGAGFWVALAFGGICASRKARV